MTSINQYFQQALLSFQKKDLATAQHICEKILSIQAEANTLHLLALIFKAQKKSKSAIDNFLLSLKVNPNQAQVYSNLANLLQNQGQLQEASKHYQNAIKLSPLLVDARINYALLLSKQNKSAQALEQIKYIERSKGNKLLCLKTKAKIYDNALELNKAENYYKEAIKISPNDFNIKYSLACLYRKLELPSKALNTLKDIYEQSSHIAEVNYILGCIYYELKDIDKAEKYLLKSLEISPEYVDAHESLNKLYWEQNIEHKFLRSYQSAQEKKVYSSQLCYSKIALLITAKHINTAEREILQGINTYGNLPQLIHALGVVKIKQSKINDAFTLFNDAVLSSPNTPRYHIDLANLLIKQEEYNKALEHLNAANKITPNNQEIWAYKGLCWRLLGDERALWLNDYDKFIYTSFLPVPKNYDNLPHFLHEIEIALTDIHNAQRQPLDQSVRGGTQTVGHLLNKSIPVIQDYRKSLTKVVQDYINTLNFDNKHPLLCRLTGHFQFAGSWSIKLANQGFHTNHIHPEGWVSGPTYIKIPKEITKDDPLRKGWVKFGETSLDLGNKEEIGKAVCPESGLVVLFPSYIWHGTYPFSSSENRITTPCDIKPI